MRFERNFSDGRNRRSLRPPTYFLPQVQPKSYSSDLLLQSIMADRHPFRMPFSSNNKNNEPAGRPPLVLLGGRDSISTCASSMTESELSSQPTHVTNCSSLASHTKYPVPPPREPPQVIKVAAPRPQQQQPLAAPTTTTLPYAQLCFCPEKKTLVTLMEINLGGNNGRRSKRLGILDSNNTTAPHFLQCQENDPSSWLMTSSSSRTCTESTVTVSSTRSNHNHMVQHHHHAPEETKEEPMFLHDDVWLEETDLDMYLLHDFEADPWRADPRGGCSEALKKMLLASRSFLVFRHRHHHHQDFSKESSFRINYHMMDNEMNSSLLDQ
jgi:hypothetical protein